MLLMDGAFENLLQDQAVVEMTLPLSQEFDSSEDDENEEEEELSDVASVHPDVSLDCNVDEFIPVIQQLSEEEAAMKERDRGAGIYQIYSVSPQVWHRRISR
jgi:hypothetical protein